LFTLFRKFIARNQTNTSEVN